VAQGSLSKSGGDVGTGSGQPSTRKSQERLRIALYQDLLRVAQDSPLLDQDRRVFAAQGSPLFFFVLVWKKGKETAESDERLCCNNQDAELA